MIYLVRSAEEDEKTIDQPAILTSSPYYNRISSFNKK